MRFETTTRGRFVSVNLVTEGVGGALVDDGKPGHWRIMIEDSRDGQILLDDNHARAFAAGVLAACDELDARAKGP